MTTAIRLAWLPWITPAYARPAAFGAAAAGKRFLQDDLYANAMLWLQFVADDLCWHCARFSVSSNICMNAIPSGFYRFRWAVTLCNRHPCCCQCAVFLVLFLVVYVVALRMFHVGVIRFTFLLSRKHSSCKNVERLMADPRHFNREAHFFVMGR